MNIMTVKNWPQRFEAMTDRQLRDEIALKDARRIQLRETDGTGKPDGWRVYAGYILKLFQEEFPEYVASTKMNETELAGIAKHWAIQLEQEYILYGVDGIRAAMRSYVAGDATPYYRFPKVGQVKAECEKLHGSPEHELGLREQARQEARIEAEHQAAIDAYKLQHPDEWRRIQQEAERRKIAQNGRRASA